MMELVCPAGSLAALKTAVDHGADAVYLGFRDDTNARQFSGLNFGHDGAEAGMLYARERGVRVFVAINTYANQQHWSRWQQAVDTAANLQVDALIAADVAVLDYASETYPELPLHLSVQASATHPDALHFYHSRFGIRRAVLPRVLSMAQVARLAEGSPVDLEVFGFGSLCIMAEGRCYLSSYLTDESPNRCGACSPAKAVRWEETPAGRESRLNGVLIDRFAEGENAGYPTLCKGRFIAGDRIYHAIETPTSLNTIALIPALHDAGIKAIKIEGRQRSPAYVEKVVRTWRAALDAYQQAPERFRVKEQWERELARLSEGSQTTLGAYERAWQ